MRLLYLMDKYNIPYNNNLLGKSWLDIYIYQDVQTGVDDVVEVRYCIIEYINKIQNQKRFQKFIDEQLSIINKLHQLIK